MSLILEAKRKLFENSVDWEVRDQDENYINLLYKKEKKRSLLSALFFWLLFWWLFAILFSMTGKNVKKQIILKDIWWKIEINWDLEYVNKAYKVLRKTMDDKISKDTGWLLAINKSKKFYIIFWIWVFIFYIFLLNSLTSRDLSSEVNNNVINTNTSVNNQDNILKSTCEKEVDKKLKNDFKTSTFTAEFKTHEQIQKIPIEWKEILITWNVKFLKMQKNYACYFDKNNKLIEVKYQ